MIKVDNLPKQRNLIFRIIDYLWSGFSTLCVIFLLLGVWQVGYEHFGSFILSQPFLTIKAAWKILLSYDKHDIPLTLYRAILGIGISIIIGVSLGLIAGQFKTMRLLLKPIISFLMAIPPIIWVVLSLFWLGFGNVSIIFTIIITVIPLTFSSAMMGMSNVSVELKEVFLVYKLGIIKKILYLYIPHLTSYIIGSISLAIGMGIKIVIMTEILGSNNGVGAKISDARAMLEMDNVLAYVCLIVCFIALCEYLILKPLEILLMPWRK